jgi:hypothetical protein
MSTRDRNYQTIPHAQLKTIHNDLMAMQFEELDKTPRPAKMAIALRLVAIQQRVAQLLDDILGLEESYT